MLSSGRRVGSIVARTTSPGDLDAVDAVRERPPDELAPQRGMAPRADPELEVLLSSRRAAVDPPARVPFAAP